jgi:hypothetical protein
MSDPRHLRLSSCGAQRRLLLHAVLVDSVQDLSELVKLRDKCMFGNVQETVPLGTNKIESGVELRFFLPTLWFKFHWPSFVVRDCRMIYAILHTRRCSLQQ